MPISSDRNLVLSMGYVASKGNDLRDVTGFTLGRTKCKTKFFLGCKGNR